MGEGLTTKGHKGLLGGDGTVFYLDCGYMTVCLSKLTELLVYTEKGIFCM